MPAEPYYFIQTNNTGSERIARYLRIPPSVMTVRDAIKRYGQREWDQMNSFAVCRNPYDRAVSLYASYYYKNKYKMLERDISFLNFLTLTLKRKHAPYYDRPRFFASQWHWLQDFSGKQGVFALSQYEKFSVALNTAFHILGIDTSGLTLSPDREPHPFKWQKFYRGTEGALAAELVQEYWADDFIHLPYSSEIADIPSLP